MLKDKVVVLGFVLLNMLNMLSATMLTGCFHLRTEALTPEHLRAMNLATDNVFEEITANLTRRLHAAGISTTKAKQTPATDVLQLSLKNSKNNTDVPVIFDSLQGTVYSYTISVVVELSCESGQRLLSTRLSAKQDILHNINQVSPPVFTPLMRRALTQQLVDSILNLITSKRVDNEVIQTCLASPRSKSKSSH